MDRQPYSDFVPYVEFSVVLSVMVILPIEDGGSEGSWPGHGYTPHKMLRAPFLPSYHLSGAREAPVDVASPVEVASREHLGNHSWKLREKPVFQVSHLEGSSYFFFRKPQSCWRCTAPVFESSAFRTWQVGGQSAGSCFSEPQPLSFVQGVIIVPRRLL